MRMNLQDLERSERQQHRRDDKREARTRAKRADRHATYVRTLRVKKQEVSR